MILKRELTPKEIDLVLNPEYADWHLRCCKVHGVSARKNGHNSSECLWFCKEKCEAVENIKELREKYKHP
jgi:hypothetical protein